MISYFLESKGYQSRRQRAYFFLNMRNVCKLTFEYTSGLGLFRYSALQDLGLKMLVLEQPQHTLSQLSLK